MTPELDDRPDYASFDSRIEVRADGTHITHLGYTTGGPDTPAKYSDEAVKFRHEGQLVFNNRLGNSLVNVEFYLSPPADWLYDYTSEYGEEDEDLYITDFSSVEVIFDLYHDEVWEAAHVRADEDDTDVEKVLAEWVWLAGGAHHVDEYEARVFVRALRKHLREVTETDWALCRGGDADNWRHDVEPVADLDEAELFIEGGYEAVKESRDD